MKFLAVVVLVIALIASVVANIAPTQCDFECTKLDLPTCATNGKCFLSFTGKCALDKYNCRNPKSGFRQVAEYRCSEDSAPRCQTGDY